MEKVQKYPPSGVIVGYDSPGSYLMDKSKIKVAYPPAPPPACPGQTVFLAGSIEMGTADRWQDRLCEQFMNRNLNLQILNPRREDWDSSWEQSKENQNFVDQVNWELKGLESADLIVMYLQPGTISPVSLLELGASIHRHVVVYCPPGFHRKGNVDIFCARHNIPVFETELEIVDYVTTWSTPSSKNTLTIPNEVISKAAKKLSWDFKEEPKPPILKVFKIKDTKTGLFSSGGFSPRWTKRGKVWSGINFVKSSLRQHVEFRSSVVLENNIPESWVVVEIGLDGVKEYSARGMYPLPTKSTLTKNK